MCDLRECPFCGSTNVSSNEVYGETIRNGKKVPFQQTGCGDCGAMGPMALMINPPSADEEWNKRSPEFVEKAELSYLREEFSCVHKCLDEEGIDREDGENSYSTWGRIVRLKEKLLKQGSEAESAALELTKDAKQLSDVMLTDHSGRPLRICSTLSGNENWSNFEAGDEETGYKQKITFKIEEIG